MTSLRAHSSLGTIGETFPQLGAFLGDAGPEVSATSSERISSVGRGGFCFLCTPSSHGLGDLGGRAWRGVTQPHIAEPRRSPCPGCDSVMPPDLLPQRCRTAPGVGEEGKGGSISAAQAKGCRLGGCSFGGLTPPRLSLGERGEGGGGDGDCRHRIPLLGKAGKSTRLKGRDPRQAL